MSELTMERLNGNLESLKMRNTLDILENYLERAVHEKLNIVEVLDHIFSEEADNRRKHAYEKQVQMSGFPIKKTLTDFAFAFQPSIDQRQIEELAAMRFVGNAENVVFLGPPGVSKAHLATVLSMVAAQRRFSMSDYRRDRLSADGHSGRQSFLSADCEEVREVLDDLHVEQDVFAVERGFRGCDHRIRHSGPCVAPRHGNQYQGGKLSAERAKGIHETKTADCEPMSTT